MFPPTRSMGARCVHGLLAAGICLTFCGPAATAAPKWKLIYYRQIGNELNGNRRTIETHCFRDTGIKASGIGVTNQGNSGSAIFGFTDSDGHNRINPLDLNNCAYDIRIYNPPVATEQTPKFYFQNPAIPRYFSYVTQWLYLADDSNVQAYPESPVYHYDLVNGLNQVSGLNTSNCVAQTFTEPPGAASDAFSLSTSAGYHAQTFVVPPGVNRIISAMSQLARAFGQPEFDYRASIRQGGPNGTQIGPTVTFSRHFTSNFKEEAVCWGLNDVPVQPNQTYALRLEPVDGQPVNVFATNNDNYPGGSLYNGATQVPGRDMVAVIVGVGIGVTPAVIVRNPASFVRSVPRGEALGGDTFTVANGAVGNMNYTISDNVDWLSVSPASGSSSGEADSITIFYDTPGLAMGTYQGKITMSSNDATNSPQFIDVSLTVGAPLYARPDFDRDGDVDQTDFGRFQACFSGSGYAQNDPGCLNARLDGDEDVDLDDFGIFQRCVSGPGQPADSLCAE